MVNIRPNVEKTGFWFLLRMHLILFWKTAVAELVCDIRQDVRWMLPFKWYMQVHS